MQIEPRWNRKIELKKGSGRDPLGLSRVSEYITQHIFPGLTSLTERARYYSFYTWAINQINKHHIKYRSQFYKRMIKFESAWILAGILDKEKNYPESKDPQGQEKGKRILQMSDDLIDIDINLYSNPGGVYNQYYKSPLGQLGLSFKMREKDILSNEGEKLSKIFESNIKNTEYFKKYIEEDKVPRKVLVEYGESSSYLRLKDTIKEKKELVNILFNENQVKRDVSNEYSRRDTLLLHLELYNQFTNKNIFYKEDDFRNIVYFGESIRDDTIISFDLNDKKIKKVLLYWKLYQFQDYFTFCFEFILKEFIYETKKKTGTTIEEFLEKYDVLEAYIKKILEIDLKNLNLLDIINCIHNDTDLDKGLTIDKSRKFDKKLKIKDNHSEKKILEKIQKTNDPLEKMAYNLILLLTCSFRYYQYMDRFDDKILWIRNREADELSLYSLIYKIRGELEKLSVKDFLNELLILIIDKHDLIAWGKWKRGNDTFKFRKLNDRYVFNMNYDYTQRGSRFRQVRHNFEDLGLIEEEDDGYVITDFGRLTLERYADEK